MHRSQRRLSAIVGAVVALLAVSVGAANAADNFKTKAAGQFVVRARAVGVLPDDGDTIKTAAGADSGLRTKVDYNVIPELDLSYFITDQIAIEAIAGVTRHRVKATLNGNEAADAGSVWLLPPTITVQYHFFGKERVSPYLGAGLNATFLFGESGGNTGRNRFDHSVGPALQAGVDIALSGNWSLNLDVKKIWLSSDYTLNSGALKGTADLNPLLVGAGLGYRF